MENSTVFLSTLPARGATYGIRKLGLPDFISIHAPREGSDREVRRREGDRKNFYPRSPRGERLGGFLFFGDSNSISIHAPREGSDVDTMTLNYRTIKISIHAPREGSDNIAAIDTDQTVDFYPRSPRGERPGQKGIDGRRGHISIHAPREGSDSPASIRPVSQRNFYPRSPRGERPDAAACTWGRTAISIHAPREGSDIWDWHVLSNHSISIHAPREGSDVLTSLGFVGAESISIHAPREGSDHRLPPGLPKHLRFLSTLPARGATPAHAHGMAEIDISIHAPREGSDRPHLQGAHRRRISIHAPREGSDNSEPCRTAGRLPISIHAPREGSDGAPHWKARAAVSFLSTLPARGATLFVFCN